jgi:hypothetical protein
MSGDEVKARTLPKSHSCGKTFPGPKALKSLEDVSCTFPFYRLSHVCSQILLVAVQLFSLKSYLQIKPFQRLTLLREGKRQEQEE